MLPIGISPGGEARAERAVALARALTAVADRWSRALAASFPQGRTVGLDLLREIWAYARCRVRAELGGVSAGEREGFLTELDAEFGRFCARHAPGGSAKRRLAGASQAMDTRLARLNELGAAGVNREAFEHFCASTGLGSEVLVGREENLASLVLYIVIHAVLMEAGPLSREQVVQLLKLAGACRTDLEQVLATWRKGWSAGGSDAGGCRLPAQTGPAGQLQNGNPNEK